MPVVNYSQLTVPFKRTWVICFSQIFTIKTQIDRNKDSAKAKMSKGESQVHRCPTWRQKNGSEGAGGDRPSVLNSESQNKMRQ